MTTDVKRWAKPRSVPEWGLRARMLAVLIEPGSSVLEFGAFTLEFRDMLPSGCTYTPSDLVDRGPGTIVCDLNAEVLPAFPLHDVAVFGGVLEYVDDVERLLTHLSKSVRRVIASYAVAEGKQGDPDFRGEQGWVNAFTLDEFLEVMCRSGFTKATQMGMWGKQVIVIGEVEQRPILAPEASEKT